MASLGAHEHWNNATDKQYTRNLGTGDGIELLYRGLGQSAAGIPSLSEWGMIAFFMLMVGAALWVMRRTAHKQCPS